MGIVDKELATFELPAYGQCKVEADVNGNVHLHLGPFRVELSRLEFLEFASIVLNGQARLHEVKADEEEVRSLSEIEAIDAV